VSTKYQFFTDKMTNTNTFLDTERLCWIPDDPANIDYQEYLAWVAEGNTAEEWTGE
jgi:hypothetical protein